MTQSVSTKPVQFTAPTLSSAKPNGSAKELEALKGQKFCMTCGTKDELAIERCAHNSDSREFTWRVINQTRCKIGTT